MEFQLKTSNCHHHGTIKPVKSKSGKHMGKWICKITGPSIAQGFDVKTLYSSPYIGAAKAAIAKFLRITVSEVNVVQSTSASQYDSISTTPLPKRKSGMGEFDDNDEEFADFDLNSAVSSAKKQQPPPHQHNNSSSPYQSAPNPYYKQQSSTPNNLKATAYNDSALVSRGNRPSNFTLTANSSNNSGKHKPPIPPNASSQQKCDQLKAEHNKLDEIRREAERLRLEKECLLKDVRLVGQRKEELEKENNNAREDNERLKSESKLAKQQNANLTGETRAVHEEYERVKSELKTAKQQKETYKQEALIAREDKHRYEQTKKEAEGLRLEKECLLKEVSLAKQQKDELEKETDTAREHIESLKSESNLAKQQKAKLKGGTRAVQEDHERVKRDLKTAKEQKETYEKEARIAREDKDRYEKEAKAVKESLDSLQAEKLQMISSSTKQNSGNGKRPPSESDLNNKTEPPAKRKKAGKQLNIGMISNLMKVVDLKEEAAARGISLTKTKMKKGDLLDLLVVGSTCIAKTDAWDEVLRLQGEAQMASENFASERRGLREKFENERRQMKEQENKRLRALHMKEEQEERERQEKLKVAREKDRALEMSSQVAKHTHHFPSVHHCNLAKTNELQSHGSPREYNARCSDCSSRFGGEAFYTCEKCDFDICQECFKEKTMTPKEKKAEAKRKAALEKERLARESEMRRLMEEEEKERQKKWDPKSQFKPKIISPAKKNKDIDGNKKKGFTVWSSDGYGNDGWHSYEGAPDKEFDSTFSTKNEANERARYLFHWQSPWGMEPERIMEEEEVEKSMKDGLVTYEVTPPDSSTWTVGVVPDAAFEYMENARGHDVDHRYTAGDFGYGSCF
mmetsp:Transcript_21529/g.46808  ORF Transcript_21529/g.46808 Transcript_21529/m.46808 type:complete len:856 (+) Transcript_21529:40-2607(+)